MGKHQLSLQAPESPASRGGFTLGELLITILVVGMLAAVAAPRLGRSIDDHRADAAAMRVESDLELARHCARMAGQNRTVSCQAGGAGSTLTGVDDPDHPGRVYSVDLTATCYPATFVSVALGPAGTASSITFNRHGLPDAPGTIVLQCEGLTRSIAIDSSGRISRL